MVIGCLLLVGGTILLTVVALIAAVVAVGLGLLVRRVTLVTIVVMGVTVMARPGRRQGRTRGPTEGAARHQARDQPANCHLSYQSKHRRPPGRPSYSTKLFVGSSRAQLKGPAGQNEPMPAAALLLTGGASRRMGQAKATLMVASAGPEPSGARARQSLAGRTADLLLGVAAPVVEVGPGYSALPAVREDPPGTGPLVAVAAGHQALRALGWTGPALVVATDLPRLTAGLLAWLAEHPAPRTVVPAAGDIPQPLCARYSSADLDLASVLAAEGRRSMQDLLTRIDALVVATEGWQPAAGDPDALVDVDTPSDLAQSLRRR
jgi:molybdopterin-guanine dinucleotide biosynthesis protein A